MNCKYRSLVSILEYSSSKILWTENGKEPVEGKNDELPATYLAYRKYSDFRL